MENLLQLLKGAKASTLGELQVAAHTELLLLSLAQRDPSVIKRNDMVFFCAKYIFLTKPGFCTLYPTNKIIAQLRHGNICPADSLPKFPA